MQIIAISVVLPLLLVGSKVSCAYAIEDLLPTRDEFLKLWRTLEKEALGHLPAASFQANMTADEKLGDLYSVVLKAQKSQARNYSGHFSSQGIEFSDEVSKQDFSSVLMHELGHLFVEHYCPGKFTADYFVHEALAQWISRDFLRISYSLSKFAYSQMARQWLKQQNFGASSRQTTSYAIARLLLHMETNKNMMSDLVAEIFNNCKKSQFDTGQVHSKMFHQLTSTDWDEVQSEKIIAEKPDFFLMDGLSMEPLLKSGKVDKKFPPGSILKPLLVALVPELRNSTQEGSSEYWQCHKDRSIHDLTWNWQDALIKSCNGFFLEHQRAKRMDFSGWINLLNEFNVEHPLTPHDIHNHEKVLQLSLGLTPGISITLPQVVGLYRWLYDHSPDIILALIETSRRGTLKETDFSKWFHSNRYALKTGTVRNGLSHPTDSWIVGVGPIRGEKSGPNFVFAIHGRGVSAGTLSKELHSHLQKFPGGVGFPAQVQILTALNPGSETSVECHGQLYSLIESSYAPSHIDISPKNVIPMRRPTRISADANHLVFSCYDGPLIIKTAQKGSKALEYYGRLRINRPRDHDVFPNWSFPTRRARVRRGSPLIIETSARHYIKNVLASEYPHGYESTLKALSLAIGYNVQSRRHGERPLCASSHCQIFSSFRKVQKFYEQGRLDDIVSWSMETFAKGKQRSMPIGEQGRGLCRSSDWYPFSIGGSDKWTLKLPLDVVASAFNLTQDQGIQFKIEDAARIPYSALIAHVQIHHRYGNLKLPCEVFRNQLDLPSCPTEAKTMVQSVVFSGYGKGHGLGLDLKESDLLAGKGFTEEQVFQKFFPFSPPYCMDNIRTGGLEARSGS